MKKRGKDELNQYSRRDFIKTAGIGALAISSSPFWIFSAEASTDSKYVWGGPSEFQSMDPHAIFDATSENLRLNLYDNLYRYEDIRPSSSHGWPRAIPY